MKKTAWLAFCFLGFIWGSNFIFVKWAAEYITPAQITLLRVVFADDRAWIRSEERRVGREC